MDRGRHSAREAPCSTRSRAAGNQRVGSGFVACSLAKQPHLLEIRSSTDTPTQCSARLAGPVSAFAGRISAESGVPQQSARCRHWQDAKLPSKIGATIIKGAQAGVRRSWVEGRDYFTLVPDVGSEPAAFARHPSLCCSAASRRGRACGSLVLGADGVAIGMRFYPSEEAIVHPPTEGDAVSLASSTLRGNVIDLIRGFGPSGALQHPLDAGARSPTAERAREAEQLAVAECEMPPYAEAAARGNARIAVPIVGEAMGSFIVSSRPP